MKNGPEIKLLRASALIGFLFSGICYVEGMEVFSTGDLGPEGSRFVQVFGRVSLTKPKLTVSGSGSTNVGVSNGSVGVPTSGNADIEFEQSVNEIVAAFGFRPSDALEYRIKVGQVRDFELEYSSGSQLNRFDASRSGTVWGLDVSGSIFPGSIVSTAIKWNVGYSRLDVELDRFQGGEVVYASQQDWRQEEFQGALNFSRRWKSLEYFGGLKIVRVVSKLRDSQTKNWISGTSDDVSPFAGIQWNLSQKESLLFEGSFVDDKSFGAGYRIQF